MPRPTKVRLVAADPTTKSFGPRDMNATGSVCITVEEFEAIRLSDYKGMDQESAAAMMGVSRHTYGRLLARARSTIARALVNGEELRIEGGNFQFCGHGRKRCRRGQGGGGRCR
ncbi:DUF134 domain-containing protein [Desulfogranum japonicum]|uniref:DUF134 domain-containing protein n=1 Tax=Desulfogranum japonicum TaxID=231447 RepID=UPI00048A7440|nr:DUF134 domain-containing protein [Desulfogranum japonicum]